MRMNAVRAGPHSWGNNGFATKLQRISQISAVI